MKKKKTKVKTKRKATRRKMTEKELTRAWCDEGYAPEGTDIAVASKCGQYFDSKPHRNTKALLAKYGKHGYIKLKK